jgi:hypothetical protein
VNLVSRRLVARRERRRRYWSRRMGLRLDHWCTAVGHPPTMSVPQVSGGEVCMIPARVIPTGVLSVETLAKRTRIYTKSYMTVDDSDWRGTPKPQQLGLMTATMRL